MLKFLFINLFILNLLYISYAGSPFFTKGCKLDLQPQNDMPGDKIGQKVIDCVSKNPEKKIIYIDQSKLTLEALSVNGPANKDKVENLKKFLDEATIFTHVSNPSDVISTLERKYNFKQLDANSGNFKSDLAANQFVRFSVGDCNGDEVKCLSTVDSIIRELEENLQESNPLLIWTGDSVSHDSNLYRSNRHLLAVEPNKNFSSTWIVNNQTLVHVRKINNRTVETEHIKGTGNSEQFTLKITIDTDEYINLNFKNGNGTWDLFDATANERNLSVAMFPSVPSGYSFSCTKFVIPSRETNKSKSYIFEGFQVQPFGVRNQKFSNSYDCAPFFTIPVWMGIFVVLIFSIILSFGIYALFSIHTMDRFDDAKSKQITVPSE